jgi:hypothetical protein
MNERNVIILVARAGDELLGCFTLFKEKKVKDVVYLFPLDEDDKRGAEHLATVYGHSVIFDAKGHTPDATDILLIPCASETDGDRAYVNAWSKQLPNPSLYYSVSMNKRPMSMLAPAVSEEKRVVYSDCYVCQAIDEWKFNYESVLPIDGEMWTEVKSRFIAIHNHGFENKEAIVARAHRHEFHVTLRVQLFEEHGEIDAHVLKDMFTSKTASRWAGKDIGTLSCAMMATTIRNWLQGEFFDNEHPTLRRIEVCVTEDGENGTWAT